MQPAVPPSGAAAPGDADGPGSKAASEAGGGNKTEIKSIDSSSSEASREETGEAPTDNGAGTPPRSRSTSHDDTSDEEEADAPYCDEVWSEDGDAPCPNPQPEDGLEPCEGWQGSRTFTHAEVYWVCKACRDRGRDDIHDDMLRIIDAKYVTHCKKHALILRKRWARDRNLPACSCYRRARRGWQCHRCAFDQVDDGLGDVGRDLREMLTTCHRSKDKKGRIINVQGKARVEPGCPYRITPHAYCCGKAWQDWKRRDLPHEQATKQCMECDGIVRDRYLIRGAGLDLRQTDGL